nr:GntR family transcriptional regulator [Leekyejoonella antrihumi]
MTPALNAGNDELSLAERSYRAIRDQLVMLQIRPGAPINEDQLTKVLAVGRTPVREALKRLETERLVVAYPRRGTFATEVHITDLTHISEVRSQLEPFAAASAATRATHTDHEHLEDLLSAVRTAPDDLQPGGALMQLDMQVHRAIYATAHNPYLEDTLIRYDNLATRIWCLFLDRLPTMAGHVAEHGPLIKAILAGDPDRAADLTRAHITSFEQSIRAAL